MAASANGDDEFRPNATVYVSNLNDRTKIPELVEMLEGMFSVYGEVVDIVAKKNLRAKGQAFVVYDSVESAQTAIDELQGFELFGKSIRLQFAKSRSDATVKREDGDDALETHKKQRLAEKERKKALEKVEEEQKTSKRSAADALAERPAKTTKAGTAAGGVVPDEYLPPNKTLFLRDLPEDYSKEALNAIFSRYPGFKELRMVPGRQGIAFAEYDEADAAVKVKEATSGMQLGDKKIRVTYQRQ